MLAARGALFAPFGTELDKGGTGFELETALRWVPETPRVSVALGYRFERFRVEKAEQELGAVTLGLAYRFGGER